MISTIPSAVVGISDNEKNEETHNVAFTIGFVNIKELDYANYIQSYYYATMYQFE